MMQYIAEIIKRYWFSKQFRTLVESAACHKIWNKLEVKSAECIVCYLSIGRLCLRFTGSVETQTLHGATNAIGATLNVQRAPAVAEAVCIRLTHIYLDTIPPTDVVWNDVATDKLTTQDGDKFRTGAGVVADVRAAPLNARTTTPHDLTRTVAIRTSLAI